MKWCVLLRMGRQWLTESFLLNLVMLEMRRGLKSALISSASFPNTISLSTNVNLSLVLRKEEKLQSVREGERERESVCVCGMRKSREKEEEVEEERTALMSTCNSIAMLVNSIGSMKPLESRSYLWNSCMTDGGT